MIRNCTKLCNQGIITCLLRKQSDTFIRTILTRCTGLPKPIHSVQNLRFKSKASKKDISEDESDSYESEDLHEIQDKNTKIIKINVTSLRVDGILKSSLGIARNKIETLFYDSKIRVNGEKIKKKSITVQEGDEIDLIKGPDVKNPNFCNVARIEILSITGNEDSISVKIKRCKSLAVDTYS